MGGRSERWAGVDVGAHRKGFHVAVIDTRGLVAGPARIAAPLQVAAWLRDAGPRLVAVDSPRRPAPEGERSRADERALARAVCGIRYTPDRRALHANSAYYAWIRHGLELYEVLAAAGWEALECFPTATWTRLGGPRGGHSRAGWSRAVLESTDLAGVPTTMNQDGRDAIGAALTARLHARGRTERFGDIVVPRGVPAPPVVSRDIHEGSA
ncbi:MAG: DUF429 domain-containing protein [Candidatus Dormibacteraeota bacterium]|nr:DUF429 domain-containing protein [Candidatus Dormibacteraeota bacterium]MBO0760801.1 DUF429 domain-containing protein [Candidatus Dormibacteraeota bacterium]